MNRGAHQRDLVPHFESMRAIGAQTQTCPACGVGKLFSAVQRMRVRDLKTRCTQTSTRAILRCRKCRQSFYIEDL